MIHSENRLAPRMVLIITSHEYRRKLEQTFQNFRIPIYYQCQGHGTAPSEMLDIFGLSGSSRLLTIGMLPKFLVRDLLDALQQRIPLHKRGGGIVLTIPITGLQRPLFQLMNDQLRETIEQKIEERVCNEMSDTQTGAGYAAIWVALSNGYSSDAIDAARSAAPWAARSSRDAARIPSASAASSASPCRRKRSSSSSSRRARKRPPS